jgi:hypothetical protein
MVKDIKDINLNKGVIIDNKKKQSESKLTIEQAIRQLIQENRFLSDQLYHLIQQSNNVCINYYSLENLLIQKGVITESERDDSIKIFIENYEKDLKDNVKEVDFQKKDEKIV